MPQQSCKGGIQRYIVKQKLKFVNLHLCYFTHKVYYLKYIKQNVYK